MSITNKKLGLGFRQTEEILETLKQMLIETAENINFPYGDELEQFTEALASELTLPVYARVIEGLKLGFAGEEINVELDYYPEPQQEDDVDVSFLKLVPIKADNLTLEIITSGEGWVDFLGVHKLEELSTEHIEVKVVTGEEITDEESTEENSEGGDEDDNES